MEGIIGSRECESCKTTYGFSQSDITTTYRTETRRKIVKRKAHAHKRIMSVYYTGVVSEEVRRYKVNYKAVECPVCHDICLLCPTGEELIDSNIEHRVEDQGEMFGPNDPDVESYERIRGLQ